MSRLVLILALASWTSVLGLESLPWRAEHREASGQRVVPISLQNPKALLRVHVRLPATSITASIVVEGDRAYFGTQCFAPEARNAIVSFDLRAGKVAWRVDLPDNTASSATLVEDKVVFATDRRLLVFSAKDGRLLYERPINMVLKGRLPSPLPYGKAVVFAETDGTIHLTDLTTYNDRWTLNLSDQLSGTPSIAGNELIALTAFGMVNRINLAKGTVTHRFGTEQSYGPPLVYKDRIVTKSNRGRITCHEYATGRVLWARNLDEGNGNHLVTDGRLLYTTTPGYGVWALDFQTGQTVWTTWQKTQHTVFISSPTLLENALLVKNNTEHLIVLDPKTGQELRVFEDGGLSMSSPSVSESYVVWGSNVWLEDQVGDDGRKMFYATLNYLPLR